MTNPQALIDRHRIRNILALHSRGVDRGDASLLGAAYHPGATVDYGFFVGPAQELVVILAAAQKAAAPTLHRTSNCEIRVNGDRAVSESYVTAYVETAATQRLVFGRYLDRHERCCGEWRLSQRHYAMGKALHAFDAGNHTYANLPYWLIIDQRYKDKYPTFTSPPGSPIPPYMIQAATLEGLAAEAGIDAAGLVTTVARFNAMFRAGHDDDFNRSDNSYDNFYMWGDPDFEPPYRTLGLIDQGPYFAVKMEAGALGTAGGPKVNGDAQVLDWQDQPIQGLYAAGNATCAVLGEAYGGAGGTLGPGLTFGYIAGRHLGTHLPNR